MAVPRIGSASVGLPYPNNNSSLPSDIVSLPGGSTWVIPSGQFTLKVGPYTFVQTLDPVTNTWVMYGLPEDGYIVSDGVNFRLANLTGCAVGALVTTAGTGYLTVPAVTPSIGSAKFTAILGGTLSTTVTVATAGVGYNHPPSIILPPPPSGGVQASAVAVVAAGAISSVTVVNQGAGYTVAPTGFINPNFGPQANTYQIIPNILDTITTPAALTFALQSGVATNVTAIVCTDNGVPVTSVPTLTIAAAPGGGTTAVATAIMCFAVTGLTVVSVGAGYNNSTAFNFMTPGYQVAGTQASTNPIVGTGLFSPQPSFGYGTTSSTGTLTATGLVITGAGLHQAVPSVSFLSTGTTVPTNYGSATAQVGGVTDTSFLTQV